MLFICYDVSPYGDIVRPSFPTEIIQVQSQLAYLSTCSISLPLLAAQCLDRDRWVLIRPAGPQLPPFTASYLLLMLRLSSFFSFSYSGSLWTANRTSWGQVMMGMGQRHSVSWFRNESSSLFSHNNNNVLVAFPVQMCFSRLHGCMICLFDVSCFSVYSLLTSVTRGEAASLNSWFRARLGVLHFVYFMVKKKKCHCQLRAAS